MNHNKQTERENLSTHIGQGTSWLRLIFLQNKEKVGIMIIFDILEKIVIFLMFFDSPLTKFYYNVLQNSVPKKFHIQLLEELAIGLKFIFWRSLTSALNKLLQIFGEQSWKFLEYKINFLKYLTHPIKTLSLRLCRWF